MIQQYRDHHKGLKIAVLGPSPTLRLFDGKEDITIAVNGTVNIFDSPDHFLCFDEHSPTRDWFYRAQQTTPRIIASYLSPFDERLYPDRGVREDLRNKLADAIGIARDSSIDVFVSKLGEQSRMSPDTNVDFACYGFEPDVDPVEPHDYFMLGGLEGIGNIHKDQERLHSFATASGAALQLAYVMGASEIHLYGCSMDNPDGKTYVYRVPPGEEGGIPNNLRSNLDRAIKRVMEQGVPVFIHGPSKLNNGIKLDA